jgi:hypothetical protein
MSSSILPFYAVGNHEEKITFDIKVDGRIILKWTKEMGYEEVDWIYLTQDRIQM